MRPRVLAALLLGVAACNAPSLTLEVVLPEGFAAEDLSLTATLYTPGQGSGVTCDAIAYGDFDREALLASLVGLTRLDADQGELGEIPRVPHKLVLVEGTRADNDARRLVAGCAELGEVEGHHQLRVLLEEGLRIDALRFDGPTPLPESLSAVVPRNGRADTTPALVVEVKTARGAPAPAGSQVRLVLVDPAGRAAQRAVLEADAAGQVRVIAAVAFTGPFAVELAPRYAPQPPGRQLVHGFADPAEREVQPVDLATRGALLWSRPTRLGEHGAGFVTLGKNGLQSPRLYISLIESGDSGAPSFDVRSVESELALPVGRVFDNRAGRWETVFLVQLLSGWTLNSATNQLVGYYADADPARALRFAWPADASGEEPQVQAVLPLGPCDGRADPAADVDAPPLLLTLTKRGTEGELLSAALRLATLDGQFSEDLAGCSGDDQVLPVSSHCVADERQALHRILFARVRHGDGSISSTVVDLGAGVTDAEVGLSLSEQCDILEAAPDQDLDQVQVLGDATGDQGQPLLLASSFLGYASQIELLRATSGEDAVLVRQRLVASGVNLPAAYLAGGAMTDPLGTDVAALMQVRDDESGSLALLTYMTAPDTWRGQALFGSLILPGCNAVQRVPDRLTQSSCGLYSADVDNDGRQELLLSWLGRSASADARRGELHAVIDLEVW